MAILGNAKIEFGRDPCIEFNSPFWEIHTRSHSSSGDAELALASDGLIPVLMGLIMFCGYELKLY